MARICINEVWYDTESQEKELKDKIYEYVEENYSDDQFDELLDGRYQVCEIAGMKYSPSNILKNCDETAYRCMLNDEIDNIAYDYCDDVENFAFDYDLEYE